MTWNRDNSSWAEAVRVAYVTNDSASGWYQPRDIIAYDVRVIRPTERAG
jgi:hypothetical protein